VEIMAQPWSKGFAEITAKPHFDQAIWWLNGFWEDGAEAESEKIWEFAHLCIEIETGRKVLYGKRRVEVECKGDLDEMQSHVFLERMGETLTVRALRKRLSDLDIDNNKRMSLSEYLLARYNKTPAALTSSDQGSGVNPAEMAAAQARLDDLSEQFASLVTAKERADEAAKQAKKDKENAESAATAAAKALVLADQKAAAAVVAEEQLRVLEAELQVAVDAVLAEEKKIADKLAELEAIVNDPGAGAVKKNKAKNEIAQVKSEDPLPLRKAKITQEAALKRAERARQPASDARAAAEAEAKAAHKARDAADAAAIAAAQSLKVAEKAKADLARQVEETKRAVAEAEAVLQELKSRKGTPHGKIWWMERTMKENQKFMPK
jgi:hypothetical protein